MNEEEVQIDLTTGYEEPVGANIDLNQKVEYPLPQDKAEEKALQYVVAAGDKSPSHSEVVSMIQQGAFEGLKEKLAADVTLEKRKRRYDMVQEMVQSGQQWSTEEQDFVMGLSDAQAETPAAIVETEFSKRLGEFISLNNGDLEIDSEGQMAVQDFAESMVTRSLVVQNQHESAKAKYNTTMDLPWQDKLTSTDYGNSLRSFIPFASWLNLNRANDKGQSGQEGTGQGAEMKALVDYVWSIKNPAFMAEEYQRTFDRLFEINPDDAMRFSDAMQQYGQDEELSDQMWSALDVVTTFPFFTVGRGLKSLRKPAETVSKTVKGVGTTTTVTGSPKAVEKALEEIAPEARTAAALKNVEEVIKKDGVKPVEVLDAAGLADEAAKVDAIQTVTKMDNLLDEAAQLPDGVPLPKHLAQDLEKTSLDRLMRQTMTLLNPSRFEMKGLGTRSAELGRRITALMEQGRPTLEAVLAQSLKVARGTEDAYRIGFEEAEVKLKDIYKNLKDGVMDIRHIPADQSISNTARVEGIIGRPQGGGFKGKYQEIAANNYAQKVLGLKQWELENNGLETYIKVRQDVDETSDAFRTNLFNPENTTKEFGPWKWALGPEDKFSEFMRGNRSNAISGSQRVQALMRHVAKPIEDLSGEGKQALERMMDKNRDFIDPHDPTKRGRFYKTVTEYEVAYRDEFGKLPTDQEVEAYFSAVQINDMDYVFRNLGIYRDKSRMGYETISVKVGGQTRQFEGKVLDDIPFHDGHPGGILVWNEIDDFKYVPKNAVADEGPRISKKIKEEGWRVIQTNNPVLTTFRKGPGKDGQFIEDRSINFVLVKDFQRGPLDFQQIPYKQGFHVDYKDPAFVKQGRYEVLKEGGKRRLGDTAAMSASSTAKAQKIAEHMETARLLMNEGKDDELARHLAKNLPEEWNLDAWKAKFDEVLDAETGEMLPPRFMRDVPFVAVKSGQSVSDAGVIIKDGKGFHELYPDLEDPFESVYNDFSKVNKQYAGSKDPTLDALEEGSEANPVLKLAKSNLNSSMDVLQNSMATIIRNRYFEDLQIISAESFVQEFGDILLDASGKAFSRENLRRNPLIALHEAQFSNKANPTRISQAKQIRQHTLDLLGTPSWSQKHISVYVDKLKDQAYKSMGDKGVELVPENLMHTIADPFHYARSIAFHSKLGLFNVVQLFTQGQTLAVTSSIAPKYATRSLGASAQMRRLDLTKNEKAIEHMANLQAKIPGFGMTKEQFKDSYYWLKETGFDLVGQDHAWRGDIFDEKLFRSKGKKFLDKGAMFFSGTERFTRINAWNTAYLEYFDNVALKGGKITPADATKILLRAKTLNVNMSRESNAVYQQGFGSTVSQFLGYQARLSELLIGKRLSSKEKLQLLTGMGALYGISGPMNTVNPFYNFYDDIREAAIARGIDPDAGLMGYVMNGIPAMLYASAFGDQPNIGERLGPAGFPIWNNIERAAENEDLPAFLAILENTGAGVAISSEIIKDTIPLFGELLAIKDGGTTAGITLESITGVMKNISSINQASKLYRALKTGEWVSANGSVLMDGISAPQAIFYAVTGTQPQDIPDAFRMNDAADAFTGGSGGEEASMIKEARTMMKKYLVARDAGDPASAEIWSQRLTILLNGTGLTATQKNKLFMQSLQGDTMVEAILRKFLKNGPPDQLEQRMKTFGTNE